MADFVLTVVDTNNLLVTQVAEQPLIVTPAVSNSITVSSAGAPGPQGGLGPMGPMGPTGPQGYTGTPGTAGQPRWSGVGPPGTIVGANPGDSYLDTDTGDIYLLQ